MGARSWTAAAAGLVALALAAAWWAPGTGSARAVLPGEPAPDRESAARAELAVPSSPDAAARTSAASEPPRRSAGSAGPPAGPDGNGTAVTVTVVAAAGGAPLAGAEVQPDRGDELRTDAEGRARLPVGPLEDPAGLYLTVRAEGFFPWRDFFPPDVRALRVELHRSLRLEVRVLLADGRPCTGVFVRARQRVGDESYTRIGTTDASGATTLRDLAPGCPLRLSVGLSLRRHHGEELTIEQDATHVIRLDDPGALAGVVLRDDGSPAARLRVEAADERRRSLSGHTDAGGHFHFEALPVPSSWEVSVSDFDTHAHGVAHLTESAPQQELELVLQPPQRTIDVRVVDGRGEPVPGLLVTCKPVGVAARVSDRDLLRSSRHEGRTDTDGALRLLPAADGDHRVTVYHGARRPARIVAVAAGVPARAELALEGDRALVVRVVDPDGRPQMAHVRFRSDGDEAWLPCLADSGRGPGTFVGHGLDARPGTVRVANTGWSGRGRAGWLVELPGRVPGEEPVDVELPEPALVLARFDPPPDPSRRWIPWRAIAGDQVVDASTLLLSEGRVEVRIACADVFDLALECPGEPPRLLRGLRVAPGDVLDLGVLDGGPVHVLRGTVLSADGAPLAGAGVELWVDGLREEAETESDARGNFRLEAPSSKGHLWVHADGHASAGLELDGSRTEGLVLRLEREARLEGRVYASGAPPAGRVRLHFVRVVRGETSMAGTSRPSEPDGTFAIDLDPGRYQVMAVPFGAVEAVPGPVVELAPGETRHVELDLDT